MQPFYYSVQTHRPSRSRSDDVISQRLKSSSVTEQSPWRREVPPSSASPGSSTVSSPLDGPSRLRPGWGRGSPLAAANGSTCSGTPGAETQCEQTSSKGLKCLIYKTILFQRDLWRSQDALLPALLQVEEHQRCHKVQEGGVLGARRGALGERHQWEPVHQTTGMTWQK